MITNPLYAGFIRWGGETAMGTHQPIITQELFDAAQKTLRERNHKTRQLRSPNYLAGLVTCGLCGAASVVLDTTRMAYRLRQLQDELLATRGPES